MYTGIHGGMEKNMETTIYIISGLGFRVRDLL